MRVITGTARGRRLGELKGQETRPTTGKVKEAVFSALQFDLEGRRVLDLFAGTGQMGIEALSRGASSCVFVDMRRDAAALVRENLAVCGLSDRAQVVCGDAMGYLASVRAPFDLVFLDPPYERGLCEKAAALLPRVLDDRAIVVAETRPDENLPAAIGPLAICRDYRYSAIRLTVYRKAGPEGEAN